MRRTVGCITVIFFQIALVASLISMNSVLRNLTTILFLPIVVFMSMSSTGEDSKESDLFFTPEALGIMTEAVLWDMAVKNGGFWKPIFAISVVVALYWLLNVIKRPS